MMESLNKYISTNLGQTALGPVRLVGSPENFQISGHRKKCKKMLGIHLNHCRFFGEKIVKT